MNSDHEQRARCQCRCQAGMNLAPVSTTPTTSSQGIPVLPSRLRDFGEVGMDQYLLIPFLVGWTSIYQLFWCSPGVQGFDTLPSEQPRSRSTTCRGCSCHSSFGGGRSLWGPGGGTSADGPENRRFRSNFGAKICGKTRKKHKDLDPMLSPNNWGNARQWGS